MDKATKDRLTYDAQMYLAYKRSWRRSRQKVSQFHLGRFAGAWDCLSDADKQDWAVHVRSVQGKSEIRYLADAIQRWVV